MVIGVLVELSSKNIDRVFDYLVPKELEDKIKYAKIIDDSEVDTEIVQIGNIVKVLDMEFDEKVEYTIVGSTEVDLSQNKISNESPMGMALLGKKKKDIIEVKAEDPETAKKRIEKIYSWIS